MSKPSSLLRKRQRLGTTTHTSIAATATTDSATATTTTTNDRQRDDGPKRRIQKDIIPASSSSSSKFWKGSVRQSRSSVRTTASSTVTNRSRRSIWHKLQDRLTVSGCDRNRFVSMIVAFSFLLVGTVIYYIGVHTKTSRYDPSPLDTRNSSVYVMIQSFCHRNHNYDDIPAEKSHQPRYIKWWNRISSPVPPKIKAIVSCHPSLNVNTTMKPSTLTATETTATTLSDPYHHSRTLTAQLSSIPAHQTVLRISKSLTIWDIDAIQDPWIQTYVIGPQQQQPPSSPPGNSRISSSHRTARTTLSAAAYLSIYLARWMFQRPSPPLDVNHNIVSHLRNVYVSTLPRNVDEFNDHPIFWSDDDLKRLLGTYTVTYHSVRHLQQMIQHEFDILSSILMQQPEMPTTGTPATDFSLSYDQYRIARVNVLSRSFGTGPIPSSSDVELQERLNFIQTNLPYLNFTNGHHVMVPILDQLNHHGQDYNVDFAYNIRNQSFMVHSKTLIPIGHEIIDHYGKHTSSHLFAKYGFINYDSSDYHEATIALWHALHFPYDDDDNTDKLATRLSVQEERKYRMQMLRYLQYDDGYETCIGDPSIVLTNDDNVHDPQHQQFMTAAWKLKQLKYKILLSIVGPQSSRWIIQMSPTQSRNSDGSRSDSQKQRRRQKQPTGHIKSDHIQTLLSTCRLFVLRHDDYNGTAVDLLENSMRNHSFHLSSPVYSTTNSSYGKNDSHIMDHHKQAFEFRSYMCLARMIQTAMTRFPQPTASKQLEYMEHLEAILSSEAKTNVSWTIAHMHYSEMQALETLKQIVFGHLRQYFSAWMSRAPNIGSIISNATTVLYTMRDQPCTFQQHLKPLLHL